MAKHFCFFKKKSTVAEKMAASKPMEDELQRMTNVLLQESKQKLQESFQKQIAKYNAKSKPLGEKDAEEIIESLLREAAIERRKLNASIQLSISEGELFNRYYRKLETVNELTNDAYVKMRRMQGAEERLTYKKLLYNNVTGNMYIKRNVDIAQVPAQTQKTVDENKEINKEGERLDETEVF